MFDGDEDCVHEHEDDNEPVERLTLNEPTYTQSDNTQQWYILRVNVHDKYNS